MYIVRELSDLIAKGDINLIFDFIDKNNIDFNKKYPPVGNGKKESN